MCKYITAQQKSEGGRILLNVVSLYSCAKLVIFQNTVAVCLVAMEFAGKVTC